MSESKLEDFVDLFTFYLCKFCDTEVQNWYPMSQEWIDRDEASKYHHSGVLIDHLKGIGEFDLFDGLMNAFQVYQSHEQNPVGLERKFSEALTKKSQEPDEDLAENRALKYLCENRSNLFIIHGLETADPKFNGDYQKGKIFPPRKSMMPLAVSSDEESYAIESDYPPFNYCARHGRLQSLFPWSYCKGYITFDDFKKSGGKIVKTDQREHFYARSHIPAEDWVFVYDLSYRKVASLKRNDLQFSAEEMDASIEALLGSGLPVVEIRLLRKFFKLCSLLEQKLQLLEICEFE